MKKKRGLWKERGTIFMLAALVSMGGCFPVGMEKIQAVSIATPAAISVREAESEWKEARQEVEEMQEQLTLYQEAMEALKAILTIQNTGSLESQLEEILIEVRRKISYTQDLKDEIEQQVTVDFLEVDTEGVSQTEAIFTKIGELRLYARNLDRFYKVIKELLGLEAATTDQEIYQMLSNLKDQVTAYHSFLDQAEGLIQPEGVNGSQSLVTGEQTREELCLVYAKMEEIKEQFDFLKELVPILLEEKEISIENQEAQKALLEEVMQQKKAAESWMNQIRILLELTPDAGQAEISNRILKIKSTLAEHWKYLSEVEGLLAIENGSDVVTGSSLVVGDAVSLRWKEIFKALTDMVEQHKKMAEIIRLLQEKEEGDQKKEIQELTELLEEIRKQKEEADHFLKELKEVLGLEDQAGYQEVIHTITNLKEQFVHSFQLVVEFMKQIGIETEEGEEMFLTKQLETIFNQVWVRMEQLETEIKKTEQAEKRILQLEQEKRILTIEKQQSVLEKEQLEQEIERLKQNSSAEGNEDWERERNEWEQKNQMQKEQITELQKKLQFCAEGKEKLRKEKTQLIEEIAAWKKEGKEYQEQIELLKKQLAEKERKIEEIEAMQKRQKPMQELLEQNSISYEQLLFMISKLKEEGISSESEKKIPVIKSEEDLEENMKLKEKEENFMKIPQETIPKETISREVETTWLKIEETSSNKEEASVVAEECTCEMEECEMNVEGCFCGIEKCQVNPEECFCERENGPSNLEECFCERENCLINAEGCFCEREEFEENPKESSSKGEEFPTNKEEEVAEKEEEEMKKEQVTGQEEGQKNGYFGVLLIFILFLSILTGVGVFAVKNKKEEKE